LPVALSTTCLALVLDTQVSSSIRVEAVPVGRSSRLRREESSSRIGSVIWFQSLEKPRWVSRQGEF